MEKIKFINDSEFVKYTKVEKMAMPTVSNYGSVEINRLILIPTSRKSSGYKIGAFFAHTPNKGWWRPMDYDCWQINTDIENPAKLRYQIIKGDFEYGGINIFGFADEHHKAFIKYGGEITILPHH